MPSTLTNLMLNQMLVAAIYDHPTRIASDTGFILDGANGEQNIAWDADRTNPNLYMLPEQQRYGAYAAICAIGARSTATYTVAQPGGNHIPYSVMLSWLIPLQNSSTSTLPFQGATNDTYHSTQILVYALGKSLFLAYDSDFDPIKGAGGCLTSGSYYLTYLPVFESALAWMMNPTNFNTQISSYASYGAYGHRRYIDAASCSIAMYLNPTGPDYTTNIQALLTKAGTVLTETQPFPGGLHNSVGQGYTAIAINPIDDIQQPGVMLSSSMAAPSNFTPGTQMYCGGIWPEGASEVAQGWDAIYVPDDMEYACVTYYILPSTFPDYSATLSAIANQILNVAIVVANRVDPITGVYNEDCSTRDGVSTDRGGETKAENYGDLLPGMVVATGITGNVDIYTSSCSAAYYGAGKAWITEAQRVAFTADPPVSAAAAPSNPTNLVAIPTPDSLGSIDVSWEAPISNGPDTGYSVYEQLQSGGPLILAWRTFNSDPNPLQVTIPNLLLDQPYKITVASQNAQKSSTGIVSVANSSFGLPLPPTNLLAIGGNRQIFLSWNSSLGATSYSIYRGTSPGGEGSTPIATNVATLTYIDIGLSSSTTYYYKIVATNAYGSSAKSVEVSGTTSSAVGLGLTSTGLTASVTGNLIGGRLGLSKTQLSGGSFQSSSIAKILN